MGNCFNKDKTVESSSTKKNVIEPMTSPAPLLLNRDHMRTGIRTIPIPFPNNTRPLIPPIDAAYRNSLTVVIDLDETLISSRSYQLKRYDEISGDQMNIYVRPYALELIYACRARGMEIVIWSAGLKYYVLSALHYILLGRLEIIDHIIWRDMRWHPTDATLTVPKDINLLGRDLSKVVIIDNHPSNIITNPDNGILVSDYNIEMMKKTAAHNPDHFEILQNENISRDATLLGLISTIHWINQARYSKSITYNYRDIRNIMREESDRADSFLLKWEDIDGYNRCYCQDTLTIDEYQKKLSYEELNTDKGRNNNEHILVNFVASNYHTICQTLQILTPKSKVLQKMKDMFAPLSPIRSHLTINPFLIEMRYEQIRPFVLQYYDSDDRYDAECYLKIYDKNEVDLFDSNKIMRHRLLMYGTF